MRKPERSPNRLDRPASATANLGVVSASTSYDASVMHGNTLTADVTSTVGRPTSLYHDSMPVGQ